MLDKKTVIQNIQSISLGTEVVDGQVMSIMPNTLQVLAVIAAMDDSALGLNEYQQGVMRTAPLNNYPGEHDMLMNGVMGLCGESGECMDILKKAMYQNHELDREKLKEELGDVLYYIGLAAEGLGYTLEEVAQGNNQKLLKRYPNGFEADRSVNRDKYESEEVKE